MTLVVDRLSVRRGGRVILHELSFEIEAGSIVGVVGANGTGKSTLLACVAGVLAPRDGQVRIEGASVWGSHQARTTARRALGYVPEGADPPPFLTAAELWALCAASRQAARPLPSDAVRAALGLDELAAIPIERMSLGMRRRACLGAALVGPPKLLVLDEPDNGLDVTRLDALVEVVTQHAADGGATLLASHDARWLDRLGARRVELTRQGELAGPGSGS